MIGFPLELSTAIAYESLLMIETNTDWLERDLKHLWHPCSQMKDYEQFPPLMVTSAKGSYIELANGQRVIDAISSWWCKSLGHNHPRLKAALFHQAERFEHVILANTSNEIIVTLSEKLARLTSSLNKVMYAGDGSCAIEMALKMSLHAHQLLGESQRTQFMALSGDYHGETCGALGVSDLGLYKKPYEKMILPCQFLQKIPYVSGEEDPLWSDCSSIWSDIEKQLASSAEQLSSIIVEPIVQGANGMLIYSADFLRRLRKWCHNNGVHFIADEVMTGIGRTGKMLACEHANIEPDFLCLSKGLTSGWLPMSAVVTSDEIYDLFYDDYEKGKSFLHSHTYSGNALAAAVAVACLECFDDENILQRVEVNAKQMRSLMEKTAGDTGRLHNIRHIGSVVAADLIVDSNQHRMGYKVFQEAVKRGAWLRPLGNTIYWLPPLNTSSETLEELQAITADAIQAVF